MFKKTSLRRLDESFISLNGLKFMCGKTAVRHSSKNAKKQHSWETEKRGLTLENKGGNMVWYQMMEDLEPSILE